DGIQGIIVANDAGRYSLKPRSAAGLVKIESRRLDPDEVHRTDRNGTVQAEDSDLKSLPRLRVARQNDLIRSIPALGHLSAALSRDGRQSAVDPHLRVVVDDDFKRHRRAGHREARDLFRERNADAVPVEADLATGAARVEGSRIKRLPLRIVEVRGARVRFIVVSSKQSAGGLQVRAWPFGIHFDNFHVAVSPGP